MVDLGTNRPTGRYRRRRRFRSSGRHAGLLTSHALSSYSASLRRSEKHGQRNRRRVRLEGAALLDARLPMRCRLSNSCCFGNPLLDERASTVSKVALCKHIHFCSEGDHAATHIPGVCASSSAYRQRLFSSHRVVRDPLPGLVNEARPLNAEFLFADDTASSHAICLPVGPLWLAPAAPDRPHSSGKRPLGSDTRPADRSSDPRVETSAGQTAGHSPG